MRVIIYEIPSPVKNQKVNQELHSGKNYCNPTTAQ